MQVRVTAVQTVGSDRQRTVQRPLLCSPNQQRQVPRGREPPSWCRTRQNLTWVVSGFENCFRRERFGKMVIARAFSRVIFEVVRSSMIAFPHSGCSVLHSDGLLIILCDNFMKYPLASSFVPALYRCRPACTLYFIKRLHPLSTLHLKTTPTTTYLNGFHGDIAVMTKIPHEVIRASGRPTPVAHVPMPTASSCHTEKSHSIPPLDAGHRIDKSPSGSPAYPKAHSAVPQSTVSPAPRKKRRLNGVL